MNLCSTKKLHVLSMSIIIAISISHYAMMQQDFPAVGLVYNLTLITSLAITVGMLAIIYQEYIGAAKFRTPYLFLFLAYVSYLAAELGWFVYENIIFEYPYPSTADTGYFFDYVFTGIFLIVTIRCFSTLKVHDVGAALLIMSVIVAIYLTLSIEAETESFDLIFGLVFILGSATVFSFALIALNKLKKTTIGLPWAIIFIAMLVTTVADVTYYTTENVGEYTYSHVMNTLWITSNALLVYALILHRRVL